MVGVGDSMGLSSYLPGRVWYLCGVNLVIKRHNLVATAASSWQTADLVDYSYGLALEDVIINTDAANPEN